MWLTYKQQRWARLALQAESSGFKPVSGQCYGAFQATRDPCFHNLLPDRCAPSHAPSQLVTRALNAALVAMLEK